MPNKMTHAAVLSTKVGVLTVAVASPKLMLVKLLVLLLVLLSKVEPGVAVHRQLLLLLLLLILAILAIERGQQ